MSAERGPFAAESWRERTVQLPDGRTHLMLVDAAQTDATTQMYLTGDGIWVNSHLVALMLALTKPGDRVVDLGAFVGEFALGAAAHGCEVVAVEANPHQARMLGTSAELNQFGRLRVLHAAAGDRAGIVGFESRGPYGQVLHGAAAGGEEVIQVTVDDVITALDWASVAFLKIDIEGAEAAALAGAETLLKRPDAPAIVIECNAFVMRETSPDPGDLLRRLEQFGYTLYRVAPPPGKPIGIWRWEAAQFQPDVVCDYLALKGRTAEDAGLSVSPPLTLADSAEMVVHEVNRGSADHRIAMAWSLQFAPQELLAHEAVVEAVASLQADPDDAIRAEAELIGSGRHHAQEAEPSAPLHRVLDGAWAAERVLRRAAEARLAIVAGLTPHAAPVPEPPSGHPLAPVEVPGARSMELALRITHFAARHPRWAAAAGLVMRRPRS